MHDRGTLENAGGLAKPFTILSDHSYSPFDRKENLLGLGHICPFTESPLSWVLFCFLLNTNQKLQNLTFQKTTDTSIQFPFSHPAYNGHLLFLSLQEPFSLFLVMER